MRTAITVTKDGNPDCVVLQGRVRFGSAGECLSQIAERIA